MFPGLPTEANRGPNLLIAEWLTLALAFITVGLRLHGRCISLNIPGWDDHTILAATVGLIKISCGEDLVSDVDTRCLVLHRPSSVSSKLTTDLGSMQWLFLLIKYRPP